MKVHHRLAVGGYVQRLDAEQQVGSVVGICRVTSTMLPSSS
jgi:hypothetical protein